MRIGRCKLLFSSRGKVSNNAQEVVVAGWLGQLKRHGAVADSAIQKTGQIVNLTAGFCVVSLRHAYSYGGKVSTGTKQGPHLFCYWRRL